MTELTSNSGTRFLVDDEDVERVARFQWSVKRNGYLQARVDGLTVMLHRWLAGLVKGDGMECDHISRDRSDNRKANLRICKRQENMRNMGLSSRNSTGVKGCTLVKSSGLYRVQIQINKKYKHVGMFRTLEEAARAYDAAASLDASPYAATNESLGLLGKL